MPRGINGIYTQPNGTSAISGQTISPTAFNTLITDLGNEITGSIARNGSSSPTANIAMGGFTLTGLAAPTATGQAARWDDVKAVIPSGTAMLFAQPAAPVGWTQITGLNDAIPRIVSGTGAIPHGSVGLSTFIANGALGHVLSTNEMPYHNHSAADSGHAHGGVPADHVNVNNTGAILAASNSLGQTSSATGYANISIGYAGANFAHTHAVSDLLYYDVIICSKN